MAPVIFAETLKSRDRTGFENDTISGPVSVSVWRPNVAVRSQCQECQVSTSIWRTKLRSRPSPGQNYTHICIQDEVTSQSIQYTIPSPFCRYNAIHCVELNGEGLSCYSNKTESVYKNGHTITDLLTKRI